MEMFGVGDERQEDQEGQSVGPPQDFDRGSSIGDEEGGEIADHEEKDQEGDPAGLVGKLFAEPDGPDEEATDKEAGDPNGYKDCPRPGEVEIEPADGTYRREKAKVEAVGDMIEADKGKREEAPEDEGMCDAGEWALPDDFALAEDFPEEVPCSAADGAQSEVCVFFGTEDDA